MIFGVGCDVLEVARMKKELGKKGGRFRDRVFTPEEIKYATSKRYPERHFAARFAAKEALFKALGTGLRGKLAWKDVEVRNGPLGKPELVLSGHAKALAKRRGVKNIFLSLSHTRELAQASVVLEA
jgi:holo-[acyl-carrier protein] synthase